ncbi:inositol monophosphatase family protein [Ectobacillus polymachus]|uniref:inositol monophosphatase family protein n=1 Tax=Ectobacillus polymachus TaxID=1508806 RepID=UPI003A89E6D8
MIEEYLKFAEAIARESGEWIVSHRGKFTDLQCKRNHVDLVTEIDKDSESFLIELITRKYPNHWILSEEMSGLSRDFHIIENKDEIGWIIDPLDGTMNFVHDVPHFAVSIAIVKHGRPIVGVVYEPNHKELYSAAIGMGAFLNGKKMTVSETKEIKNSLLHTGYCAMDWIEGGDKNKEFPLFFGKCRYLKVSGSAALDLAYVAAGRLEGYWQSGLSPWDIAAGVLLVEEAGGKVTGINQPFLLESGEVIASNGRIHEQIQATLQN